jgi:TetR/AcrR family transcriptional regulator, repressor for neighboring sulfatase
MTTPMSSADDEAKPRGKDEVTAALLAAANTLFGERGPDDVSVRDVATRAGVNHALLHRHFGSKDKLLRAVLSDHAIAFRESAGGDSGDSLGKMFDTLCDRPAFIRVLAHLILAGHDPSEWVLSDGGVARLVELLASNDPPTTDDRIRAALLSSISLGWLLFEPFLLFAAGAQGEEKRARDAVRAFLDSLDNSKQPK